MNSGKFSNIQHHLSKQFHSAQSCVIDWMKKKNHLSMKSLRFIRLIPPENLINLHQRKFNAIKSNFIWNFFLFWKHLQYKETRRNKLEFMFIWGVVGIIYIFMYMYIRRKVNTLFLDGIIYKSSADLWVSNGFKLNYLWR